MLLDEPGTNVALAAFHVRRLMSMTAPNWSEQLDLVMGQTFGPGFQSRSQGGSLPFPKVWLGGNNYRKVMYIDGVRDNAQATALYNGYDDSAQFGGFNPLNRWLRAAADYCDAFLNQGHVVMPEYLDVVGYSAGGAIGVALKDKWIAEQSVVKSRVITFGSPRSGNTDMRARLSRSSITRWFTPDDPVPLIPPRVVDVPALFVTNNVLTNVRFGNYVHVAGGVQVNANGTTKAMVLPEEAAIHATTSILAWLIGIEGQATGGHALTTYNAYLSLAETLATTPATQDAEAGPAEQPNDMDRRHMNRQEERVLAAIANAGHAQNNPGLVVPEETLFKAERVGGIWSVTFGGELIAVSPIEKRARSIARSGNAFLRKLPRQALVDPGALAQQMEAFLLVASDPTSGFVPHLNTGIEF